MTIVGIQHGDKEPIVVTAMDTNGLPVIGKTDIKIKIRRQSDNYYFDWSDNTFKLGVAVSQLLQALDEVSVTFSAGEYRLNSLAHVNGFDTSLITNPVNNDIYFVCALQIGGTDVANLPQYGEIKVGTFVVANHTPVIF
jgi:hypothetical protein